MEVKTPRTLEWRHETSAGEYVITSALRPLNLDWINRAFGTEDMYWAKPLPKDQLSLMLSQSLNLGVYKSLPAIPEAATAESPSSPRTPSPSLQDEPKEQLHQVGFARFTTDYVTFAYLTDVYIDVDQRHLGLGKWLIKCCREFMDSLPAMRRCMLMASPGIGKTFYTREFGFYDIVEESERAVCMTKRGFKLE